MRLLYPLFGLTFFVGVAACGSSVDLAGPEAGGTGGTPTTVVTAVTTGGGERENPCQGEVGDWLAFGSTGTDDVDRMVVRQDGTIVLAGRTEGDVVTSSGLTLAEGLGGSDAFLLTVGPDLVPREVRLFGDIADQGFTDIALTPDGGLVLVGDTEGTVTFGTTPLSASGGRDVFVVKLDAQGDAEWTALLSGAGDDEAPSVAVDDAGRVVVGANVTQDVTVQGTTYTSAGASDVLLVQFDAQGTVRWSGLYGDEGPQWVRDLDVFSGGAVVLTGSTNGRIDFGKGPVGQPFEGVALDAFLARIDVNGEADWSKAFEQSTMVRGRTVVVDGQDDVITAGQFTGTVDFGGEVLSAADDYDLYMLKLSPDGDFAWARHWGAGGIQNLRTLNVSSSDELLFAVPASAGVDWGCGALDGSNGSPEAGFLRLRPDGTTRFVHVVGDPPSPALWFHQYGEQAHALPDGSMLALGAFHGAVELDDQGVSTAGDLDVFLAIVRPE